MASLVRLGGALRAGSRLFMGAARRRTGVRHSGDMPLYRRMDMTKNQNFQAELLSAFMWFWILWHFWHDPDLVLGHFPYPDPSQWTDEELGIVPEDEE
ncbi:NADH dehydrogenase (ubiquinone) 1 beta subcomplex [Pristimantis euphronides]